MDLSTQDQKLSWELLQLEGAYSSSAGGGLLSAGGGLLTTTFLLISLTSKRTTPLRGSILRKQQGEYDRQPHMLPRN